METTCFECGDVATENHHVIPRSLGGTKTVPLCATCHGRVHDGLKRRDGHARLVRDALAAYKARGGKLGASLPECRNLTQAARVDGAHRAGEVHAAKAQEAYTDLLPTVAAYRDDGLSLRAIASRLNADGQTTRTGKPWNQTQVARVLARA